MAENRIFIDEARLEDVRRLAGVVNHFTRQLGVPSTMQADLELAVVEAANNIVLHGLPHSTDRSIALTIRAARDGIVVVIEDRGASIPGKLLSVSSLEASDAEHGRGISLIFACVDNLEYTTAAGLNRLTLFKAASFPERSTTE